MLNYVNDKLEVISKKITNTKNILFSKIQMYLDQERKKYFLDTIKFIIFYGILMNLILTLIFQIEFNLFNILAGGALYYVFIDGMEFLADLNFILFKRGEKK